jgi:hypothetical protein
MGNPVALFQSLVDGWYDRVWVAIGRAADVQCYQGLFRRETPGMNMVHLCDRRKRSDQVGSQSIDIKSGRCAFKQNM